MTWALIGSKIMNFLKEVPIWVWILIVFLITLQWTKMSSYKKGGEDKAKEIETKQAEVKAAVNERATEIISEERTNADAAIEARDNGPSYPDSRGVPEHIGRVIFRD